MTEQSPVAAIFNRVAETYDQVGVPWFTPIAEHLVREMAPRPGERALDVGVGRGAALWPIVDAVGASGSVTAIDISDRMIAATAAEVQQRGYPNVTLEVADAASPDLPASAFDLVTASLVLFFLPDPEAALTSWLELLKPGGRLGIATFASRDAAWNHLDDVFTPYLPKGLMDARTSGARGPFASDSGVEALLRAAGFTDVRTTHLQLDVTFDDAAHWERWTRSQGQISHWLAVPEDRRSDVLADAAARLEHTRRPDGQLVVSQDVRYTFGAR